MTDGKNNDFLFGVVNRVNHPVIANANPPGFASAQFDNTRRTRIFGESKHGAGDAGLNVFGQPTKAFLGGRVDVNRVAHTLIFACFKNWRSPTGFSPATSRFASSNKRTSSNSSTCARSRSSRFKSLVFSRTGSA